MNAFCKGLVEVVLSVVCGVLFALPFLLVLRWILGEEAGSYFWLVGAIMYLFRPLWAWDEEDLDELFPERMTLEGDEIVEDLAPENLATQTTIHYEIHEPQGGPYSD